MELLKGLNSSQREAVVNYDAPSLIVAGAGSGKTRVLTSRIAYMLHQGVPAHRIMALTFTNKAAAEMRERIGHMIGGEQSRRLWMGTFHSIFLKILRYEAARLGYPSSFTIYDTADSRNLIKQIVREMNLAEESYKPNTIQARISLAKNNLVTADAYEANAEYTTEDRHRKMPAFAQVYKEYARRCRANAAMDFDDMLLNVNILLRDAPDVLAKYQERFQYLLVDEYQDTNYAQYVIIRRLAAEHSRVCVVGDDAQSIYSFRGAKIENILRFRNDFPDAQTFKLEQNYRSTQTIVNAANSVIKNNVNRLPKESFSAGAEGEKIKVLKAYTDQEEASMVADELRRRVRTDGAAWSDAALLYRTNMQSRVFEEAFRRRGIPYRIYGGMSFYQRKEVKDLLAYMHLIVNPRDNEAFRRIVNYPARGIGDVTVGRLAAMATARGVSLWEVAAGDSLQEAGLNAGAAAKVREFVELISSLSASRAGAELYEFGLDVATRSGIIGNYKMEQTPDAQSALDNIEELLNSMQTFARDVVGEMEYDPTTGELVAGEVAAPSVADWLQSITLLTDQDNDAPEDRNKVTLMTIHAAKGLEYRYVFVAGLEENLFPSAMSMDGADGIEEERRLFYVALTRAKEVAVLSFAATRYKWGSMEFCRPSRFLKEIDRQHLDATFDLEDDAPKPAGSPAWSEKTPAWSPKSSASSPSSKMPSAILPKTTRPDPSRFRKMGVRPAASSAPSSDAVRTVADSGNYVVGQRVAHSKFGIGTITSVEQAGNDHKVTVDFDTDGPRTLLTKFAKLAIVG
ncbi:MAG: UvrD-helicase domain-containing protein [Rikenellaceae bacterium]|nr:UvrD-helicase domain-containing protein [Rikenellaceae bacterium]MCL2692649.1 UvrD-helicase domain-containing protein [Rikenellaceae bacterium]